MKIVICAIVCSADMQPCNGPNQLCDISGNCAACMDGFVWNNGVCVPGKNRSDSKIYNLKNEC